MNSRSLIRRTLLSLLLLLPALTLGAQEAREAILAFSAKVKAVDCDFTQTKESSLLAEAAVSSGHMTYRRPAYLEWQYLTPVPIAFIADGDQVGIKREDHTEPLTGNQGRMMKEMTRMIVGNIEGSALMDEKYFQTQYEESADAIIVTLFPKKREMQKMWSRLLLYYDKASLNATRFELYEVSGDLTTITFSKIHYDFSE